MKLKNLEGKKQKNSFLYKQNLEEKKRHEVKRDTTCDSESVKQEGYGRQKRKTDAVNMIKVPYIIFENVTK